MATRWHGARRLAAAVLDRLAAADPGMVRLRYAVRVVLATLIAAGGLALAGLPFPAVMVGAILALNMSTGLREATTREKLASAGLVPVAAAASLTLAALLPKIPVVVDSVFVAVTFVAVWLRRFPNIGFAVGMAGFMSFFAAVFTRLTSALLPVVLVGMVVGVLVAVGLALLLGRESRQHAVRRMFHAFRARLGQQVDQVSRVLEEMDSAGRTGERLDRYTERLREGALMIEAELDRDDQRPAQLDRVRRQLVTIELAAERLALSVRNAVEQGVSRQHRADLLVELRQLRGYLGRDPSRVIAADTREILATVRARRATPVEPDAPAPHRAAMGLRRAVSELVLATIQTRRYLETQAWWTAGDTESERPAPDSGKTESGVEREKSDSELRGTQPELGKPDSERPASTDQAGRERPADQPTRDGGEQPAGDERGGAGHEAERPREPGVDRRRQEEEPPTERLSPSTRQAVQTAVACALAIVASELVSPQRWYWAVITCWVVFIGTSSRGDLLVKGFRRVLGTLLGVLAGMVVALLVAGHPVVVGGLMAVGLFLAFYLVQVSYSMMSFFLTVTLGLLYDLMGMFTPQVFLLRLVETLIGALAGAVAAAVVLPTRTGSAAREEVAELLNGLSEFVGHAEDVLAHGEQLNLIEKSRELDRRFGDLERIVEPLLHRFNPFRDRRDTLSYLVVVLELVLYHARNLATAAETAALAGHPGVTGAMGRIRENLARMAAVASDRGDRDRTQDRTLVVGPSLSSEPGELNPAAKRVLSYLDRFDEASLGLARPLAMTTEVGLRADAERDGRDQAGPSPGSTSAASRRR
ncbi:FUSC family protein [Goodfellowiella coeruleoviolacea]|uniref:FUSC family protein n=1 Tax=Goodfellowiella coeruleoviolacea TaxID=334858 RepID=UPI0027DF2174|nr:FUSC family protein [Goodfellowiella coeruleoviolacea]